VLPFCASTLGPEHRVLVSFHPYNAYTGFHTDSQGPQEVLVAITPKERLAKYREYLQAELEGAGLYLTLAEIEPDPSRKELYHELAKAEVRHASRWADKLGIPHDQLKPVVTRKTRTLSWLARRFGMRNLLPLLLQDEYKDFGKYSADPDATGLAQDERSHARVLELITRDPAAAIQRRERQHRRSGGSIRAAVLGINDGLVSNFGLTMGVAGGSGDPKVVLLAGIAGLLAGSLSMAAGEYVSMRAQREVYERQIDLERAEIQEMPEEEEEELALIYRAKGIEDAQARQMARIMMANPSRALGALAMEELGLSDEALGSPWGATISSFLAFSVGAIVPILPYIAGAGSLAFTLSAALSAASLIAVGGMLSAMSGRNPLYGAARMLAVGCFAAGITYGIGRLLGVAVS
jgi:VIT1/CCC1 family predicted Fe2+/Mn2+ transporter